MPKLLIDKSWDVRLIAAVATLLGLDDAARAKYIDNQQKVTVTKEQVAEIQALAADPTKWQDDEDVSVTPADADADADVTVDVAAVAAAAGHTDAKEGDVIDVAIASQRDRDAVQVGSSIVSDAACKIIDTGYEAKQKVNIAPLLLFSQLAADAKAKGVSLLSLPVPNSLLKGGKVMSSAADDATEIVFTGNETPVWDKYTYLAQNDKGKQVKRNGSYFASMFDASPLGVEIGAKLKSINHAMTILPELGTNHAEMGDWKGYGLPALQRRKALHESRRLYGIGRMKDAVKIARQCAAFDAIPNDHTGAPSYSFDTEKQGNEEVYVNRNEPLSLSKVKEIKKGANGNTVTLEPIGVYSLAAFLRFNVAEAIVKAGGTDKVTVEHILATVKRDKTVTSTATTPADDWSKHPIENIRQGENVIYSMAEWIDPEDRDLEAKVDAAILKRSTEKDGDEFVIAVGRLYLGVDRAYTVVRERFDYLMAQKAGNKLPTKKVA